MIRMAQLRDGDIAMPQLVCDICMEPVLDVGMAMVVWFRDLEVGDTEMAFVVHKCECDWKLQAAMGARGRFHDIPRALELLLEAGRVVR